jgi:hypothetical protein
VVTPRCTLTQVWELAIAQGGPRDGLAALRYEAKDPTPGTGKDKPRAGAWTFTAGDFEATVDDCAPQGSPSRRDH